MTLKARRLPGGRRENHPFFLVGKVSPLHPALGGLRWPGRLPRLGAGGSGGGADGGFGGGGGGGRQAGQSWVLEQDILQWQELSGTQE